MAEGTCRLDVPLHPGFGLLDERRRELSVQTGEAEAQQCGLRDMPDGGIAAAESRIEHHNASGTHRFRWCRTPEDIVDACGRRRQKRQEVAVDE